MEHTLTLTPAQVDALTAVQKLVAGAKIASLRQLLPPNVDVPSHVEHLLDIASKGQGFFLLKGLIKALEWGAEHCPPLCSALILALDIKASQLNDRVLRLVTVAAEHNALEFLQFLHHDMGIGPEQCGNFLGDAMEIAVELGHLESVKLLVELFGASDYNMKDYGCRVLRLAIVGDHVHILEYLHQRFGITMKDVENGHLAPIVTSRNSPKCACFLHQLFQQDIVSKFEKEVSTVAMNGKEGMLVCLKEIGVKCSSCHIFELMRNGRPEAAQLLFKVFPEVKQAVCKDLKLDE